MRTQTSSAPRSDTTTATTTPRADLPAEHAADPARGLAPARGGHCLIVDPSGAALARYAFTEAKRRGFLPRGLSLECWMLDGIYERAHLLVQQMIGINFAVRFSATPELRKDGEGGEEGLRTFHMAG